VNADQFAAALDHAAHAPERAIEATVRIHYVAAYRSFLGMAAVDTGLHRAAFVPVAGEGGGPSLTWEKGRSYPSPGDGLARTIASGFRAGDRIGFEDRAQTKKGFRYGIMIQTPAQRVLLGFPAGSRPAVSPKAPEGDYGKVYERLLAEVPRDLEYALARELEASK
jgi:hypothetical protein